MKEATFPTSQWSRSIYSSDERRQILPQVGELGSIVPIDVLGSGTNAAAEVVASQEEGRMGKSISIAENEQNILQTRRIPDTVTSWIRWHG